MDKNIVRQMSRIDHENDSSSETPHTESSDSFKVQNSLKNSLINECNLTIQSIISSFESLDEASLQSLSRTLKDIHNEISCGIKPEVGELNSAIKTETVIGSVPVIMHNSIFIPQTDLENDCVVHLAPEMISNSLLQVNSSLTSSFLNQNIERSADS
ncbi:hypothetical protein LSTR_LSTR008571 [Laodelphax striatellus]|uniref:Uncharacterized protein n=1 Tax=Laodelphax striatellus TaxID=195883 RepID=A0A482WVL2_LAOST|nr:hypothetical protein LSTR_LSTR008571 [Laodelphax striatellus]